MPKELPENLILLCGELLDEGAPCAIRGAEDAVAFSMKVTLPTGVDVLPVLIPKSKVDETVVKGATISVTGRVLPEEVFAGEEYSLVLRVLVDEVYAGETEIVSGVFLTGSVLRKPYSYPIEGGERAELQIALEDEEGNAHPIPVSAQGNVVNSAKSLQLGDVVSILGQLHSYEYLDLDGASPSQKTAYEVEILHFTALPKI